ncbi:hypothetical protein L1987_56460 [Smallanthus sonchifolius]|uniref:Uncharacterized protein n=1 Tax=Smallanthus sonchifolius TaxID=185202 RepID=A0ACB9EC90_9ASTR|nr:hypothetical protein L1987_56460 [Smallanthus sonchifolius]
MDFHSFNLATTTCSIGSSPQNLQFYTAPSSPIQLDTGSDYNDHEFEFEVTTRMFTNRCEFQQAYPSFWWTKRNDKEQENYRLPARAKSFCSGQTLPLKPPPCLQTSVSSSPRSPNSMLRLRFSRPCAWNDDFDPFQFALEKVSDETRARMSFHRRSQSYNAYKTSSVAHCLDGAVDHEKDHKKQEFNPKSDGRSKIFNQGYGHVGLCLKPNEHLKPRGPTLAKMMEHKDPIYSRRVIPSEHVAKQRTKPSSMVRTATTGTWLKDADHEHMKGQSESRCRTESKMHRVISFLFKLKKGSNKSNRGWKLRRCLGYAPGSPPFMK